MPTRTDEWWSEQWEHVKRDGEIRCANLKSGKPDEPVNGQRHGACVFGEGVL